MFRTNEKRLVKMSVVGEVTPPLFGQLPYRISAVTGEPVVLPGTGGITYNVRVGDSAVDWEADHVEPGVTIKSKDKDDMVPQGPNFALNVLSCIGNEAVIISGEAKGRKGVVTGKHGFIEHVIVDFDFKTMDKMVIGDKVLVKSFGVGLKLLDFPDVALMSMDPRLLKAMDIDVENGKLVVPVTHIIPSAIMGSGLGQSHAHSGDYDIQLFDAEARKKHNLDSIRMGDIVAISDADHRFGRIYRKNATVIGIVVHSRSVVAGHGPGVTTLMTSRKLRPVIDVKANIATILKLRR